MTTLRRERRIKFTEILIREYGGDVQRNKLVSEMLADASISRDERLEEFDIAAYLNSNRKEYFEIIKKHIPGASFKKIADARDEIMITLGDNMKALFTEALARGIPDNVLKFSERCAKALGLSNMPLDPVSIDAYKWIMEQPQTIEQFAEWAKADEGGKFLLKYRKGAGMIKNDWVRAFSTTEKFTKTEGGLYV